MIQRMAEESEQQAHPWRNEQRLCELYVERELSQREIASKLGCSRKTVGNWIDRFGIERDRPWRDPERLSELREQGLSLAEIGDRLGTTQSNVSRWMRRFDLDTSRIDPDQPWQDENRLRELYWQEGLDMQGVADELGCSRITVREWMDRLDIETRSVLKDPPEELTQEDWLEHQYIERGRSTYDIAEELACAPSAVFSWLKRHGIETRSVGSQPGELHHRWQGGREPYYGSDWCDARRSVLQRDDHQCTECGMDEADHQAEYGYSLHVHHLKPLREFEDTDEANARSNLTTLCHACHMSVESADGGDSE